MSTRVPSSPGPQYSQSWMYWFWDWVRANRAGYAGTGIIFTGDALGTLVAGTSTLSLSTTGVTAGTYGAPAGVPRFNIDAKGRVLSGTTVGTLNSLVIATHLTVNSNGTFLGNLRVVGARIDANYAGLIAGSGDAIALDLRNRAADDFAAFRFLNNAATLQNAFIRSGSSAILEFAAGTGFTAQFRVHTGGGTFSGTLVSPYASFGTIAGTYGTFGSVGSDVLTVSTATGAFSRWSLTTSGTSQAALGSFTSVLAGDLGTFARFSSLVGAGDVLGTTTTGTFTAALSTTGVAAGTYGTSGTMVPLITVDAKGRITSASNQGITFPSPSAAISTFTGDALGTGTFPGGAVGLSLSTTGVTAGTYGGTAGVPRFDIDAKGRVLSGTHVAFPAGGATALAGVVTGTSTTGTITAAFAPNPSFAGTATSTGVQVVAGSSTVFGQVPMTLLGSVGLVTSTATSFSLMTSAIPANVMQPAGRGFEITAWGSVGTAVTLVGLVYGTGTLVSLTSGVASRWSIQATVLVQSGSVQKYFAEGISHGLVTVHSAGTLALTASTAAILNIQGTKAASTAAVAQEAMLVKFFN